MIHIVLVTMILSPENPTYLKHQKSPLVNFLVTVLAILIHLEIYFKHLFCSVDRAANILFLIGTPDKTVYTPSQL
jgi:hypothetical protein